MQDAYQVSLDTFHGPLDLLLFLIRRAEVDVQDIPISTITEQYLAFLREQRQIDIDVAGEFLVMAATLIEIKSRTLMPPAQRPDDDSPAGGLDPVDPRYELVQQLLAYQRFRLAAESLDERRHAFERRSALRPARAARDLGDDTERLLEIDDVHAMDLADAYERIVSSIDFSRLGEHHVEIDDTPIELHQEDLLDRLQRSGHRRMSLQQAFEGRTGGQRCGLFLATLELTRRRLVTVRQDEIDHPIELLLVDEESESREVPADELEQD